MSHPHSELETYAKLRIGNVLRGKYRLDSVLGIGGMAVVYKATHRNQAEFAVKILHPELSRREDVKTRFLREGYAANSVKHPGAVLVVDDDVAEDGSAFLVMELLDGEGVEALWERFGRVLPVRAAVMIVHQFLDVLAAAHAKGIVHRDIKPANLFVTRDGTVKVLDFGIARARDAAVSNAHVTGTGILLGTPAFMPPEQALAKTRDIDGQTDVWAAGATLFTLMSGHLVHEGENAAQLMIRAATAPARSLAAVAPHVPREVCSVVDRALSFDKGGRWPTAAIMRDAIEASFRSGFGTDPSRAALVSCLQGGVPAATLAATALDPTPPLVVPTSSTSQPIVSSPLASVPGVRASNRKAALAILFITTVIAVSGVAVMWGVSPPPPTRSSPPSMNNVPTTFKVPAAEPAPKADVPAQNSPPPRSVAPASPRASSTTTRPTESASTVVAPPPSSTITKPKPNCNPNFVFDSDGNKHFKPDCF